MSQRITLIGVWKLQDPLLCKEDVLAQCFKVSIGGIDVQIIFPSFDKNSEDDKLDMPFNHPFTNVYWGRTRSAAKGQYSVDAVLVVSSANAGDASRIYEGFTQANQRFSKLAMVLSNGYVNLNQPPITLMKEGGFSNGLELYDCSDGSLAYCPNYVQPFQINLHIAPEDAFLGKTEIVQLLGQACSDEDISLSYELLINAYEAVRNNDFRSAVVLGGCALEEAIKQAILRYYEANGLRSFDEDNNTHRTLGGKLTWVKELGLSESVSDRRTLILDMRNGVAHDGACPCLTESKVFLKDCSRLVRELCPSVLKE